VDNSNDKHLRDIISNQVICQNCGGILQYDEFILHEWFHISDGDFRKCKGLPPTIFRIKRNDLTEE